LTHEQRFPHSLGLLYSAFTYFTGFKVNSGEYKLMGLAPYGRPIYTDLILEKLIDLKPDGSFRMDMSYFNYCQGLTMTSPRFNRLFGGPPRQREAPVTQREMDVAASIQAVTEEIMLRCARHVHETTKMKNLCLAGGVALNCVANGRILTESPFEKIWVQPAAGDAGGSLGVAQLIWYQLLGNERIPQPLDNQKGSLLGPAFGDTEIRSFLDKENANYHCVDDDERLYEFVVQQLIAEKVVGWFQGRMEFGPRALGSRSIIGDARSRDMQSVMNLKIKFRESFRPFAPIVLQDQAGEYFDVPDGQESPYMLLVFPVSEKHRTVSSESVQELDGFEKLKALRSDIPAVTHVDFSARVQTVDAQRHDKLHRLMRLFQQQTGCPVLINTSFNVRGEPIVCSPEDAYRCFLATNMDVLVMEHSVLLKTEQPEIPQYEQRDHIAQFELD
jgi:carbamoyltransferase